MPAVWLPYGSTSISIRIDPEDLAWVVSRELVLDYSMLLSSLKNILKDSVKDGAALLLDPTLPAVLKQGIGGGFRELLSFDLLSPVSTVEDSMRSACLVSCPHPDALIGFRGLGENLFPFYPKLWKEFTSGFLEAAESGGKIDLKPYLSKLCDNLDLKVVTLIPLEGDPKVISGSPVEVYEALNSLQPGLVSTQTPVQVLVISAGGNPFDESLSRAMSIIPNCLQGAECDRIILAIEGLKGLGLPPDLVSDNAEPDSPLIAKYISFCRNLLNGKTVHVVSAIPEPLLRTVLDCRAHDALLDAYRASRLFLAKGSKTGIVTNASFTVLRFETPKNALKE
ncbi:MAG: hypothetical protein FGF48_00890 [Candidatus Brockarchaeota archaeon]|nr:hypothetical protein [Candidatus Brockarchaeota archaeon]